MPSIPFIFGFFLAALGLLAIVIRHVYLDTAIIAELVWFECEVCECEMQEFVSRNLRWRVSEYEVMVALFGLRVLGLVKRVGPSGSCSYINVTKLGKWVYRLFNSVAAA